MRRVLVIGATGTVGREVVARLAERGVAVTALSRSPETARFDSKLASRIDVAPGDVTVPESLDPVLDGVDTVFLVWAADKTAIAPALRRIATPARRVVFLSAPVKTGHPFFQQPNPVREIHQSIERLIEASGAEWTLLRPGIFCANAARWWAVPIRAGKPVRWPYLAVPTAPVDQRDIAAVAVRALLDDNHAGREHVLTGSQVVTQREQLAAIGSALGRAIEIEEIPGERAVEELARRMPEPAARMLVAAWAAARGLPAFTTAIVESITGSPALGFSDWVRDHLSLFQKE